MPELIRYFINSVMGLAVDYATVILALTLHISYEIAIFMGLLLGGCVGFLLLTFWVFPSKKSAFSTMRIASYLTGLVLIYCIRASFMYVWYALNMADSLEYFGLLCAFGLSFCVNFLFQKFFYLRY